MNLRMPTRLDWYPAKMVSRLADDLVSRYAIGGHRVLDPFCGSGAILVAAQRKGIPVSGVDINPIAGLFSKVKCDGFSYAIASRLLDEVIRLAGMPHHRSRMHWDLRGYWFTPGTLDKFERIRWAAMHIGLCESKDGQAVLLSLALSVRLCSKADQRSPKPFISKQARALRTGRHFDPFQTMRQVLADMSDLHGRMRNWHSDFHFHCADVTTDTNLSSQVGKHSHVITSPPYINAQDYYRNFKLELHVLEGLLPFRVSDIREHFIGTERGDLLGGTDCKFLERTTRSLPQLRSIASRSQRSAHVVHRYLHDMSRAMDLIKACLEPDGKLVIVCGDNLISGVRIRTWQLIRDMAVERGFDLFDVYSDRIGDRLLPPKRCGHKGLIKEEVVCAFRLR